MLEALHELAGRVTLVDTTLQSANPGAVAQEAARLRAVTAAETDPQMRAERQRALDAVNAQSASLSRLVLLR